MRHLMREYGGECATVELVGLVGTPRTVAHWLTVSGLRSVGKAFLIAETIEKGVGALGLDQTHAGGDPWGRGRSAKAVPGVSAGTGPAPGFAPAVHGRCGVHGVPVTEYSRLGEVADEGKLLARLVQALGRR